MTILLYVLKKTIHASQEWYELVCILRI